MWGWITKGLLFFWGADSPLHMVLGIPTCTKLTPSHPQDMCRFIPIFPHPPNSMKCPCCCSHSTCAPSSETCFLPQGNYLLLTRISLLSLLPLGWRSCWEPGTASVLFTAPSPMSLHNSYPSNTCQINKYHPSFSKYSYNPKSPPSLPHLYTSHVWSMVCCILVAFTFFSHSLLLSPYPPPHALQKKRMFLKFGPRNNVPVPQDWVGRELLRDTVLREALSPVSLTSEW